MLLSQTIFQVYYLENAPNQRYAMLIPLLKAYIDLPRLPQEREPRQALCYPIAAVKYGIGYLILVGMHLTKKRQSDFDKVIVAIQKLCEKLGNKGTL